MIRSRDTELWRRAQAVIDAGANAGQPAHGAAHEATHGTANAPDPDDSRPASQLVHELQVHQVELELQNEELERLRAEAAAARDRYASLFELAPVGFLSLQPDGVIIEANRVASALLECPRDQLPGRLLTDFLVTDDRSLLADLLAGVGKAMSARPVELRLAPGRGEADGATAESASIQCEVSAVAAAGNVMLALVDISARQRAAELMQRALLTLEQAGVAKSEFLSRMSHELRTPLNAVMGFSQLMLRDRRHPLDELHRTQLGHVMSACEHLVELIDDLMDIGRIESGRLDLVIEPVAVGPLITGCLDMLLPRARLGRVDLKADPIPVDCHVRADASRLRQVLLNVFTNAIKYNRPEGEVRVHCECPGDDDLARIVVTDTGRGMSAEQQQRLFQRFERLGAEHTSVPGSGLGLVISRMMLEAMMGAIDISSEPGRGTTVTITLPLVR